MSSITLIQSEPSNKFAYNVLKEFENNFHGKIVPGNPLSKPIKLFLKLSSPFIKQIPSNDTYFSILMGVPQIYQTFPYFLYKNKAKGLYIFDCWEYQYTNLIEQIKKYHITNIFVSAQQAAAALQKLVPNFCQIEWLPEAIDPSNGYFFQEKTIDVLQFGRRYEPYHQKIIQGNYNYCFDKFLTHADFCNALAKAKISICFPSNITHPERSGNISTMTVRYLQSMLSKCLIVGSLPNDMAELFKYNPIVEADLKNPVKQLENILKNYNNYLLLIEKNYQVVLQNHTWQERIKKINQRLNPGQ